MAYDEGLAERVRGHLEGAPELREQKMFGGLCFMVAGHMCVGIMGDELMVRGGKERNDELMARPNQRNNFPRHDRGRPAKIVANCHPCPVTVPGGCAPPSPAALHDAGATLESRLRTRSAPGWGR